MNKIRKASSIALCLAVSVSLLAACGSKEGAGEKGSASPSAAEGVKKEGFPIVDKPITLKVMSQDAGKADWNQMPVLKEMEKLT